MRTYPKIISLQSHNRYNENVELKQIKGKKYKFVSEDDYLRLTFEEDNKTIHAVDPSDGPFLCIGYSLDDNFIVDKIYHSLTHQCIVVVIKQK